ncbi:MAG TPA: hypothetical protein VN812_02640 [Candidatus Acidoferrales bacterium]|nr:hypothetical protein [Candidatus Acidoferrales bacterium]
MSQRAATVSQWRKQPTWNRAYDSPNSIALDHLTLARAALYRAILENSSLAACHSSVDSSMDGLLTAGRNDYLPHGLLTRAWLRVLEGDVAGARADLDEAWQIAERGSMKLHMADIHLHRARLFRDTSELAKARALIEECGYWRRKEELEDAEAAAGSW